MGSRENRQPFKYPVYYPHHAGYYMKRELSPQPHKVVKEVYQLDKDLIRKINNSKEAYTFTGKVKVFDNEHEDEPVIRNTTVLENYVNKIKPPDSSKLRIFARGGPLCTFLAANIMRIAIGALDFEYNEKENVLRLFDTAYINTNCDFTMMARHRLTGNKSEIIEYSMNTIYRVMEINAPDYDLFYCKEIDGFDGDEPLEIRRALKNWYLNGMKVCYKSSALANIKKIGILVGGDGSETIDRVTISDDFSQIYSYPELARTSLFGKMAIFFRQFIPLLKLFKSGTVIRANGGTIIDIDVDEPWKETRVIHNKTEIETLNEGEKVMLRLKYPTAHRDLRDLIQALDANRILACFLESAPEEEINNTLCYWWKHIVEDVNPDLTRPPDLISRDVWTFSPYFFSPPILPDCIIFNNVEWNLSQSNNVLVGPKRENIQALLDALIKPLPDLSDCVYMTVYTQEPCEDILSEYFGELIIFDEPEEDESVIYCTPVYLPYDEDFRESLLAKFTNKKNRQFTADLYLVGKEPSIKIGQKWDNKRDLEHLETFVKRGGLDPIRKFPLKIALFSKDPEEILRVQEILEETHSLLPEPYQYYAMFQAK